MASSTPATIYAYSSEVRTYTVNFANFAELQNSDTINGVTSVTSDPNDGILVISNQTFTSTTVSFKCTGGVAGSQYLINCIASTAGGATLLTQCNLTILNL